jgi:hypothetical protein
MRTPKEGDGNAESTKEGNGNTVRRRKKEGNGNTC